ncbi:MAG: cupin domain-containing protein, partial [Dehalococcoidia bacterium]|nr:cupin domain-containing protein [Dehalococcoidia bacterium]
KLGVAAVDVSKIVGKLLTDAHAHDCAEVYMAPSPNRGDMVFEITLDDEVFTVESPVVIYVPAGVEHKFKALKAEREGSYFYGILLDMKKA